MGPMFNLLNNQVIWTAFLIGSVKLFKEICHLQVEQSRQLQAASKCYLQNSVYTT